ncbi:MAG: NADH-quinone oxidoreductase subunit NuoB [Thiovulaceae bacterium]|nr:NADH-quinone oxidoreductase subunit NuoB [Sulfurimonadaceae bacterium]
MAVDNFIDDAQSVLGDTVVTTKLESAVNWARESSLWPMIFGTACCAIEFMSTTASKYDIARFGAEAIRFSPRQADLLIVAGTISYKQGPVLKQIYDQMPEPKWVIAMGACASSGGFYDNYTTMQGIDELIPVDVYVAGCPPRPEALLDAIMFIQKQITTKKKIKGLQTQSVQKDILCK